jgi:hypothetical protein
VLAPPDDLLDEFEERENERDDATPERSGTK